MKFLPIIFYFNHRKHRENKLTENKKNFVVLNPTYNPKKIFSHKDTKDTKPHHTLPYYIALITQTHIPFLHIENVEPVGFILYSYISYMFNFFLFLPFNHFTVRTFDRFEESKIYP